MLWPVQVVYVETVLYTCPGEVYQQILIITHTFSIALFPGERVQQASSQTCT